MNALVVNCSSRYNLGAERLAMWLRGRGVSVQAFRRNGLPGDLDLAWADEVYLSAVFSWDLPVAASIAHRAMSMDWVEAERIHIGGPAVEYNAAWVKENAGVEPWRGVHPCAEVEVERPPRMTWTSRGCVNRCPFCIVWRLQDGLVELDDWQPAPVVMDDNFLATSPEHQERVVTRLAAAGFREIDFNQGLDARRYTPDFRRLLEQHGIQLKPWRFAYDSDGDWPAVRRAIKDIQRAGVGWRDICVYVLYNYRETPEEAIERCERVIGGDHDTPLACPWPMAYKPLDWLSEDEEYVAPGWTVQQVRDVRRYYSRPSIWRSAAWESYDRACRTRRIEAKGYPADWGEIAGRIKTISGWQCEHCSHPHDPGGGYTLTVHHIDSDPANNVDDNLVALCQRCHLSWQQRWSPAQTVMDFARPDWMARRGLGTASLSSTGEGKKDAGDKQ